MSSTGMIRVEEPFQESSHRFDRTKLSEKMDSFDNFFKDGDKNNDSFPVVAGANNHNDADDILSLDDSIENSVTGRERNKQQPSQSHAGALEQTLKLSPVKRSKTEFKSPKSATRKGLTLARFLKAQNQSSPPGKNGGEGSMPGLEPIWQYSDIMSVGAASKAAKKSSSAVDASDTKSVYTYHPSSGNYVATSDQLWDRATKTFAAAKAGGYQRSLSVGPTAFAQKQPAGGQGDSKPLKRSQSLDPARVSAHSVQVDAQASPFKSPRRKLKKQPKESSMSQSDHVATKPASTKMLSPLLVSPSAKDTKSRLRIPSKASQEFLNATHLTGLIIGPGTTNQEEKLESPKDKKTKKKDKASQEFLNATNLTGLIIGPGTTNQEEKLESPKDKKKKKNDKKQKERSKSIAGGIVPKIDAQESSGLSGKEKEDKTSEKKKKKRSKSLGRANLYEHESVEVTKRDPNKRRASKREYRASLPGDARSVSSSPKPNRNSSAVSLAGGSPAGGQRRMSRRQLLKKMDSESVISAPAGTSSMGLGGVRSRSPRPGKGSTTQLPRRGDSRRNLLGGSLHQPNDRTSPSEEDRGPVAATAITTKLPRRGDSRRNLTNDSNQGPSSAKTPRRKLSTDPVDRRALVKRMESVNSFFGKGVGEIGSSYPSMRSLMIDDEGDEEPKKPESVRRKGKKPTSSRNLA